jgi:hypothetical protein
MTDLSTLADQVDTLTKESVLLDAGMFKSMSLPSPEQVNAEILKRDRFRTQLKALDGQLSAKASELRKMVADVQALRNLLEIADDTQKTDIKELDELRWNLIHDEKIAKSEATRPVRTVPSSSPEGGAV